MASVFDDSLLDDPVALARADAGLRELAAAGARVRIEAGTPLPQITWPDPRGVILAGAESRLLRSVIETTCPAPMLAWSFPGLPGWAGPLDLIVAQGSGESGELLSTVAEAVRRGCSLLVAAPEDSPLAAASASSGTVRMPMRTDDPLAAAVRLLQMMHEAGLAPRVVPESVAQTADLMAQTCGPHRDLSANPAKDVAVALADAQPLLWGGSVLAARAARRIAEALRHATGRPALAAPAEELAPLVRSATVPDLFDDPDESPDGLRPVLVTLEDATPEAIVNRDRAALIELASQRHVRHIQIDCQDTTADPIDRYVSLLLQGRFAAEYLRVGLGLTDSTPHQMWTPGQ